MASLKNWLGFAKKSVITVDALSETTREGINKAYIPKFLYKPPYGYPRFANLTYVRYLATTPYVEMCIRTVIDEIASIEWDIVIKDGMEEQSDEAEIENIRNFFNNPNTNKESFEEVFVRMPVRDVLEVNSAVLNKVYNMKEEMVEIVARDGATFTKNPDIHGMYTNRDDIILPSTIVPDAGDSGRQLLNPYAEITATSARERAAYFQYGWITGPIPVPFGKKEIIWIEQMKRTDDHYGFSPVQTLAKSLQMLMYMIESDLEYYNDNNVPKGIIGLDESDADEIKAFKEQWFETQRTKDEFGSWKKIMNKVPIVNKTPTFQRIEFSASEMQVIEKQKWYTKMVWACFGVTAVELGYTEDSKGAANQIVQSKVFRKKAINPMLRNLESDYNMSIVSEFGYQGTIKTKEGKTITKDKYEFKFKKFDVDEETTKYELYKLQTSSGLKTINEIRKEEGMEELEWGDDAPKDWMQSDGSSFNFGEGYGGQGENYSDREKRAEDPPLNDKKSLRGPPEKPTEDPDADEEDDEEEDEENKAGPGGHVPDKTGPHGAGAGPGQGRADGSGIEDEDKKKTKKKKESKTLNTDNPLILKEGEEPTGYEALEKAIKYVNKNNEEELKKVLGTAMGKNTLKQVKDINSIIAKIKAILSIEGLRQITNKIIRNNYMKGWDEAEKDLNINILPDQNAIDYMGNYTYDNIKGMNDDIAEKLRGVMQRSFMDGSSLEQVKGEITKVFDVGDNRVSMIARTESNRAANFGRLHGYQKAGQPGKKVYSAHIDDRTSELCKRLNGQEKSLNEDFVDPKGEWQGPVPPAHVNCRSSWTFKSEEEDSNNA